MQPMTYHFRNDVVEKRPCIRLEWCIEALKNRVRREVQAEDGRIRYWIWIEELRRHLRVATLPDGVTLRNAFPDRRFKP